jgi:hypothetical protein
MLINLTNHPSDKWSFEQKSIAEAQYGAVTDLEFPQIPPEAGLDYVIKLAHTYLKKVEGKLKGANNKKNAVHIMGELTFTYTMINFLLREKNIPAVASTTQRDVEETPDGKISRFKFVRFREYF